MRIIYIIFFLISIFCTSQTNRFIYEVNSKKDSTENKTAKEYFYLDINPEESFYYARPYFIIDSIYKATGEINLGDGKLTDIIRKNLITKKYETFILEGFDLFKIVEETTQNWNISTETKILNNLMLQKATTTWGGRNWISWFNTDFPFQEGPHQFNGLPGLIVEIADDKDNYHFNLIRSEKFIESQVLDLYKNYRTKAVEIPISKYMKLKLETYYTPLKAAHDGTVDYTKTPIDVGNNKQITNLKELRAYENGVRKSLMKYNNPIELDKAPNYPQD